VRKLEILFDDLQISQVSNLQINMFSAILYKTAISYVFHYIWWQIFAINEVAESVKL
jgi:hypothetical protein